MDLIGYDAETGGRTRGVATNDNLLDRIVSELDDVGVDAKRIGLRGSTFKVQLPPWLRQQLLDGNFVRVHWPTLRTFSENQQLAKRLWIYLQAEHYKPRGGGLEGTWIAVGDRLFAALGMDYDRPRDARAALVRACKTILQLDVRYRALDVVRFGRSWRINADRLTADELRRTKDERLEARAAARAWLGN